MKGPGGTTTPVSSSQATKSATVKEDTKGSRAGGGGDAASATLATPGTSSAWGNSSSSFQHQQQLSPFLSNDYDEVSFVTAALLNRYAWVIRIVGLLGDIGLFGPVEFFFNVMTKAFLIDAKG